MWKKSKHALCQAVANKFQVKGLPNQFSDVQILVKVLVSKQQIFKKVRHQR